jgi:hypothetical protein
MAKKFYKEDNENIPSIIYSETQPPVNSDGNSYSEITDQNQLDDLYFKLNKKLIKDGNDYVARFKVENFSVKYRSGLLTDQNVDYLYNKLSQLLIRLEDGSWNSAKYVLQNTLNTINQSDIDNGYTQEIHDKILNDITTYLDNI